MHHGKGTQAMAVLCVEVIDTEEGLSQGWLRQEMGAVFFSVSLPTSILVILEFFYYLL